LREEEEEGKVAERSAENQAEEKKLLKIERGGQSIKPKVGIKTQNMT
jgi:hypothetical protein